MSPAAPGQDEATALPTRPVPTIGEPQTGRVTQGQSASNGQQHPDMSSDYDERGGSVANLLWRLERIEERQKDILAQLSTVLSRQDAATRSADDWRYRMESMLKGISEKKPNGSNTRVYEIVIVALLGAFVALAGGKALTLAGILG